MDQILPYVAHSLCEILNSTSVEIYSLDEDTNTVAIVSEYVAPEWIEIDREQRAGLEQTYALDGLPVTADILAQRLPVQARVDDPGASPYLQAGLRAHGAQATLLLPMVVGDRVLGFVQVWEGKTPRHFTEGEVATGQILVNQAAITADNARLVEALRQRTVELQARNEELDAFAHTVAHDLKNPLAALITFSGLLERRFARISSDKKFLDNLQMMTQSGRKINTIINELLLLTSVRKLEEVTMEPLDMDSVVAEVQRRLADLIEEHRAEITVMGEWPVALGRGPWVEEVWANYVSNALKYGGQPPRVELGATEQEDGTVRFWVRDNGPGLTPEEQAQLFTPFTRLDQVRTEGHGLGLSIVRRIVEKLGGQFGVESTPGQGSTFFFALPRALQ
jgi:signal transduction histidine kinase